MWHARDRNALKFIFLGKDGDIKLSTSRVERKEVFSLIDTMPMRKREMQSKKYYEMCAALMLDTY
jgi:hypothetical protein